MTRIACSQTPALTGRIGFPFLYWLDDLRNQAGLTGQTVYLLAYRLSAAYRLAAGIPAIYWHTGYVLAYRQPAGQHLRFARGYYWLLNKKKDLHEHSYRPHFP